MEKPQTLSVKDWIIRNMSVKSSTQERVIEVVVNHQFTSAYKALHTCHSLEFSGFGKLFFNVNKARRKLIMLEKLKTAYEKTLSEEELTEQRIKSINIKLDRTNIDIQTITPLLHD